MCIFETRIHSIGTPFSDIQTPRGEDPAGLSEEVMGRETAIVIHYTEYIESFLNPSTLEVSRLCRKETYDQVITF